MLWKSRSAVDVRRAMGRLINETLDFRIDDNPAAEMREETRSSRSLPLMVVPVATDENDQPSVVMAFSRDLSCTGVAVLATEKIPTGEVLCVLGNSENRSIFRGQCRHSRHLGFGCYQSGVQLTEALPLSEYAPLVEYIETLESMQ